MKKLDTLRVIDVVESATFKLQLRQLLNSFKTARAEYGVTKRIPLDRLIDKGIFTAEDYAPLYLQVLDKELDKSKWSSAERAFIKKLGDAAFYKTMQILQNENTQDDGNN